MVLALVHFLKILVVNGESRWLRKGLQAEFFKPIIFTHFVRLYYISGTFRMQNREKLSPTLCFAGSRQAVVRMPSSNFSLQSFAAIYRALQNIVWTIQAKADK